MPEEKITMFGNTPIVTLTAEQYKSVIRRQFVIDLLTELCGDKDLADYKLVEYVRHLVAALQSQ